MPNEPPQFFQRKQRPRDQQIWRDDVAVYGWTDESGKKVTIAVQCVEGGGNVPREATSLRDTLERLHLRDELEAVTATAAMVVDSLKTLSPGQIEVEFGVELGGSVGVPLITQGEAKANFKITLKWSRTET